MPLDRKHEQKLWDAFRKPIDEAFKTQWPQAQTLNVIDESLYADLPQDGTLAPAIEKANSIDDRPVVLEFRTDSSEKVFPMVPAGASNDDLVLPNSQQPNREFLR